PILAPLLESNTSELGRLAVHQLLGEQAHAIAVKARVHLLCPGFTLRRNSSSPRVHTIIVWSRLRQIRGWASCERLVAVATLAFAMFGLLALIVYVPEWAIDTRGLTRSDWLTHVQNLRSTILQGLGGLAF